MNICLAVLLIVSPFFGLALSDSPKIKADDLKRLTGPQWMGTLTYLDYSKNKKVSIPSNLTVKQSAEDRRTWIFEFQYPDEPQANSKQNLTIGENGKTFGDEEVFERNTLADKRLRIVTRKKGMDNDKAAIFRFTYLIGAGSFSIKKEVKYEESGDYFERNEYNWRR